MVITGRCHCGNVAYEFHSTLEVDELQPRACDCTFCRAHGAKCVSDAKGAATISVRDNANLTRHRFGMGTADFLVCGVCGVYLGALITQDGVTKATLNLRASRFHDLMASSVSYGPENEATRIARRMQAWTPATLLID